MYIYKQLPGSVWSATGGPTIVSPTDKATPTRAGRFIIASIAQHTSERRWRYSTIPWGAPMRLNKQSFIELQVGGRWRLLSSFPGWESYSKDPLKGFKELSGYYLTLLADVNGDFKRPLNTPFPRDWALVLPSTWVFNDFGPTAVKYFVDYNHNRKLDRVARPGQRKEEILSDFLHTTPPDELAYKLAQQIPNHYKVHLVESHGCVHMDPAAMRQLVDRGVLRVGASLEIHPYSETGMPPSTMTRPWGEVGTEIHFFPWSRRLVLYKVSKQPVSHSLHPAHG
jgi:hypothetical protein